MSNSYGQEARAAAKFSQVITYDKDRKPKVISVPGHSGRRYNVILRRVGKGLEAECLQEIQFGFRACPSVHKVCYHIKAAIIVAASYSGFKVAFTQTEKDARRLRNLGMGANKVISKVGSEQWFVTFRKDTEKEDGN